MLIKNIRKNINLFVDGRGYAGTLSEFTPPKLTLKTEDYRAGGMVGPVKLTMGMDPLTTDFTLAASDPDVLAAFGLVEGSALKLRALEALENFDGTVTQKVHVMQGKVTEIDQGNAKPGDVPAIKVTMGLTYYKLSQGGVDIQEIDLENMVASINGVDSLAAIRGALGL